MGDTGRRVRMFAVTVPGLGPILLDEIGATSGMRVTDVGADGRSELVLFEVDSASAPAVAALRVAEDVFVEVGRVARTDGDTARRLAGRMWRGDRVAPALSRWTGLCGVADRALTYRVIVRVLREGRFRRTDLRQELIATVARDHPRWRVRDPARLEVWALEYRSGRLVMGLRTSDATMRQHGGRRVERPGALRPAVAAAMVRLAVRPGCMGRLLDPCCGSGSILSEAAGSGWAVRGTDIDADAVSTARRNVPGATVGVGDVRRIELPDASVDACVSNLPFGRRYRVEDDMDGWLRDALTEMARITRAGGRVVVLAPEVPRTAVPRTLRRTARYGLRLLGMPTAMWCYERTGPFTAETTSPASRRRRRA